MAPEGNKLDLSEKTVKNGVSASDPQTMSLWEQLRVVKLRVSGLEGK